MAVTLLSQASAFNPGADLWIIPSASTQSSWRQRVDWYLNFKLTNSHRHQSFHLNTFLQEILEETELKSEIDQQKTDTHAPLMIGAFPNLPCRWVVEVPVHSEPWAEQCHLIWKQLNFPSLRVFLPQTILPGQFQEAWLQNSSVEEYSIVSDS